jgi:two-component system sensor histidine kinase YesM
MRFQLKLITIYAAFMLVAAIIIGVLLYNYSVQQLIEKELDRLNSISEQATNQMLEIVDLMKYRTDTLLSDPITLNSLRVLSRQNDYKDEYIREARNELQKSLITDSVMSKFYRVIIFNESNEFIATKQVASPSKKSSIDWALMPWLADADAKKGQPILVTAHNDVWGVAEGEPVFSLIREVQGTGMGYIEIEQTIAELKKLIKLSDETLEVIIFVNKNEPLYTNIEPFAPELYMDIMNDQAFNSGVRPISNQEDKLISKFEPDMYGIRVMVMKPESIIEEENRYLLTMVVLMVMLFYMISLGFIVLLSQFLTRPIRRLREVMEKAELSTDDFNVVVDVPNDEIEALSIAYQNVLERLKHTLEEEKQIMMLQKDAQYDLLQAQVNPHFLFNVLNVISNKGLMVNDESICEICGNLADMLRYSTNVVEKYATIEQEIEYVEKYLNILRSRYEHKLEFNVECDALIKGIIIPKITLQQFVENSIKHAFKNTSRVMKIELIGKVTDAGWSIVIKDNGCGFPEKVLKDINHQFESIKSKMSNPTGNIELEIGGMGFANIFARMYLLYGGEMDFLIVNNDVGASVEIIVNDTKGDDIV